MDIHLLSFSIDNLGKENRENVRKGINESNYDYLVIFYYDLTRTREEKDNA